MSETTFGIQHGLLTTSGRIWSINKKTRLIPDKQSAMCQTMGNPICRAHTSIKRLHQIDKPSTTTSKYKVRKLRQNQGLTVYNNNKIYTIRFHKHARKGLGPTNPEGINKTLTVVSALRTLMGHLSKTSSHPSRMKDPTEL